MHLRSEKNKNAYKQINQQIADFEDKLRNGMTDPALKILEKADPSFSNDPNMKNMKKAEEILGKKVSKTKEEVIKKKKSKKINVKKLLLLIFLILALIVVLVLLYLEG